MFSTSLATFIVSILEYPTDSRFKAIGHVIMNMDEILFFDVNFPFECLLIMVKLDVIFHSGHQGYAARVYGIAALQLDCVVAELLVWLSPIFDLCRTNHQ